MGTTGVIDRTQTAHERLWGIDVEVIASKEECGSDKLLYVVATLAPGQQTQPIVHDDCEVAWFLVEGQTECVLGNLEDNEYQAVTCGAGSAGYVAPGEVHIQLNTSETEATTFLMAHVGINNVGSAAGRSIDLPGDLQALLAEHGFTVPDA